MPLPPECYESPEECERAIESKLNEVALLYLSGLEELAQNYGLKLKDFAVMLPNFDIDSISIDLPSEEGGSLVLKLEGTVLASALFEPIKDCPKNLASVYGSLIDAVGKLLEEVIDEVFDDVYEKAEVYLEVDWENLDVVIKDCPSSLSAVNITGAMQ